MSDWIYDLRRHQYRNVVTGEILSFEQMVETRNGFVAARSALMQAITRRMIDGEIGFNTWEELFRTNVRNTFESLYLLGVGGTERATQLSPATRHLENLLLRQVPFADAFTEAVRVGRATGGEVLVSDAQLEERVTAYMGSAIEAYEQGNADDFEIDLPYYPGDSGTECLFNCRCAWRVTTLVEGDYEVTRATWETMSDDRVCDGCEERARESSDLVLRRERLTDAQQRSLEPAPYEPRDAA